MKIPKVSIFSLILCVTSFRCKYIISQLKIISIYGRPLRMQRNVHLEGSCMHFVAGVYKFDACDKSKQRTQ